MTPSPHAPSPIALVDTFTIADRYQVHSVLARGRRSALYRARDPELDRHVAVKLLTPPADDGQLSDRWRERALHRVKRLAAVADPGLSPIFDIGPHRDGIFVAMELVQGAPLPEWTATARPSSAALLRTLAHSGRALATLHTAGLRHGALTAEDILVLEPGVTRLVGIVVTDLAESATPGEDQRAYSTLALDALRGRLSARSSRRRIPRRLAAALARGASPEPARQHASMTALLSALERVPRRGATRVAVAAAAVTTLAAAGYLSSQSTSERACRAHAERADATLAAALPTIRAAFATATHPNSSELMDNLEPLLTAHAARLRAGVERACSEERPDLEPEAAPAVLDQRMRCLELRHRQWSALLARLSSFPRDAKIPAGAARAVVGLPQIATCFIEQVKPVAPPPLELADAVAELERALDRLQADTLMLGSKPGAETLAGLQARADAIVTDADALGYHPTLADALLARGYVRRYAGARELAVHDFEDAANLAEQQGLDALVVLALHEAAAGYILDLSDVERAGRQLERAGAKLERIKGAGAAYGRHLDLRGHQAYAERRFDDAARLHREALTIYEGVIDADTRLAQSRALLNLGRALSELGRRGEALRAYQRSVERGAALLGVGHPLVSHARHNMAAVLLKRGEFEQAYELALESRDLDAQTYGDPSRMVARDERLLATTKYRQHDLEPALEHALRSASIYAATPNASKRERARALDLVAVLREARGDVEEAYESYTEALELLRESVPRSRLEEARVETHRGQALTSLKRHEDAISSFNLAIELLVVDGLEPTHPRYAEPLSGLADVYEAMNDRVRAREYLERAVVIKAKSDDNPNWRAGAHWQLVRLLDDDLPRRCELAASALAYFSKQLSAEAQELTDEIRDWRERRCR